jgi:predicted Fe-Mo cluster-binding NifX family protein
MGVTVMLAGGMGDGAINILNIHDISVIRGCSGNVKALAELYLKGELSDSGKSCSQHSKVGNDHTCKH